MKYKNLDFLSEPLNKLIDSFIDRADLSRSNIGFLYDILGFAFDEGRFKGKEDLIEETKNNENNEED